MQREKSYQRARVLAAWGVIGLLPVAGCGQSGPVAAPAGSAPPSATAARSSPPPPPPRGQSVPAAPGAAAPGTGSPAAPAGAAQDATPASPATGALPATGAADESGPFAAGKKVFASNNCARCHSIGGVGGPAGFGGPMAGGPRPGGPGGPPGAGQPGSGQRGPGQPGGGPPGGGMGGPMGGRGMARGPDLAKVGAKHDADWIAEHVRNPKTHKQDSRMPSFAGKIGDEDLKAMADYLASLK